jgi:hypothetical protein
MLPKCCKNNFVGWYCPKCGAPLSFIEHGGSEPVPIGQLSTKNVTVNQQLIQGDYISAGGTKIGTNLGTAVSGNVSVGQVGDNTPPPPEPLVELEAVKSVEIEPPSTPRAPPTSKTLPPPPPPDSDA